MKYSVLLVVSCLSLFASSRSFADECPANWSALHPDWIWCDDFESDKLSSYFDRTTAFSRTGGIGLNGTTGMQATFTSGVSDAGSLKLAFGLTPPGGGFTPPVGVTTTTKFRDVYYRVYVKSQVGWQSGSNGNQSKLSRATSFVAADWSQAMIAHLWSNDTGNNNYLRIDPAGCVSGATVQCVGYNDFAHLAWLGAANGTTAIFAPPIPGTWNCIETHVRLNDAGLANGVHEFWIDDKLEARNATLNFVGSFTAYGINAILLENYINNGAPQTQKRYWDNFVVSRQRIGCSPTGAALPAPQNLRIVGG